MNALEGRFQEVESRMVRTEGACQEATKRVADVESRQSTLEKRMQEERERMRKERMEEMRERDIRRKNVVMHRVGEAGEGVRTVEQRKEWDLKSCDNIFKALNLNMKSENVVRFCRRVGEKGEGPRPLVVGFRRESQREDLLEKAKDLKDTNFAEIMIIPDLTQEQRREEAEMVTEAVRRNAELSEEDKAKNLEWSVMGARGERRLVKSAVRARGAGRGGQAAARARGDGRGGHLLPSLPRAETWGPSGSRGAAGGGTRGRPSERTRTSKRRRGGTGGEEDDEDEEGDEMEEGRTPPPPPQART
jgi:hypothetical protein